MLRSILKMAPPAAKTAGGGGADDDAALPPTTWTAAELAAVGGGHFSAHDAGYELAFSKYNPTPGTGRTGFSQVPPNPYSFYDAASEVYAPLVQPDGGQLSEWAPMYAPSKEQADADRAAAYAARVPHGYVAPGAAAAAGYGNDDAMLELTVVSDLHEDSEYGATRTELPGSGSFAHSGGAFVVRVAADARVEELRRVIRDVGGVPPALLRLSYAGKALDDAQRTLRHYGVAYWHAKFPAWPLRIRKR